MSFSYIRLLSIHQLFTGMSKTIADEAGNNSKMWLPLLYGKLEAEYLISLYDGERTTGFQTGVNYREQKKLPTTQKQRFNQLKKNNYRSGRNTIMHVLAILENDPAARRQDIANARVALGDWHIWFNQLAPAKRSYQMAYKIMAEKKDSSWLADEFGEPRELPASAAFQPGVIAPPRSYDNIDVRLRFNVSRAGKAKHIQLLSPSKADNNNAAIRAYKMLRDTRFRPAMRYGEFIASSDLERDYKIAY